MNEQTPITNPKNDEAASTENGQSDSTLLDSEETGCFHCHEEIVDDRIIYDAHAFCCNGCKNVYQLLSQHQLGDYYLQDDRAGIRPLKSSADAYTMLDDPGIRQRYIEFQEGDFLRLTVHLPQIHCASCIYLLEHLSKLNKGVIQSTVNFPKRLATITVNESEIKLSELALLLTKIGYTPDFNSDKKNEQSINKRLLIQLGFAGFAFGSIMLWSFPEYLGIDQTYSGVRNLSAYLSLLVSIPVLVYSAQDYFRSALGAIRIKTLNLDIPIAIGIIALYARSLVAILNNEGPGYMDSFAGFIFFLLIGKWFQSKTYQWLSFERDFTAYFPVAVIKKTIDGTELCPIDELEIGDELIIRNEEIVPCDSVLLSEKATIDYSFVTGEADWIEKQKGDLIYAGGKICGDNVQLSVLKTTSRSTLTQLWNEQHGKPAELQFQTRQDRISRYFIAAVLLIASGSALTWSFIRPHMIPEIVTSVLIVACPCALALSVPFTYGNMLRKLGRKGFYLRNTTIIERIQECDTIVFDKTGTLTEQDARNIHYDGSELTKEQYTILFGITKHATHPYAQAVHTYLKHQYHLSGNAIDAVEIPGQGIAFGNQLKLGNAAFTNYNASTSQEACSYLSWEGEVIGKFTFESTLRAGLEQLIASLGKTHQLAVLSGDKPRDLERIQPLFPVNTTFLFEQQPLDKKMVIDALQSQGKRVLMIGDGLNDAGALSSAFVGLALSEDLVRFTPASDCILKAQHLAYLAEYLTYIQKGKRFLKYSFAFSLVYNLTGIGFAVSGSLTPFVAAVIMPLSSITVVGLATFLTLTKKLSPAD
jgi:Cu+-exporting ATPase